MNPKSKQNKMNEIDVRRNKLEIKKEKSSQKAFNVDKYILETKMYLCAYVSKQYFTIQPYSELYTSGLDVKI